MAKAERKNTICPTGYFSPRKRTSADITANSSADITLSEMALRTFMDFLAGPATWSMTMPIDHAADAGGSHSRALVSVLTKAGKRQGIAAANRRRQAAIC